MNRRLTAIAEREGDDGGLVPGSRQPGKHRSRSARGIDSVLRDSPVEEIDKRLRSEVCVTHVEVAVGQERDTTTVPDHTKPTI